MRHFRPTRWSCRGLATWLWTCWETGEHIWNVSPAISSSSYPLVFALTVCFRFLLASRRLHDLKRRLTRVRVTSRHEYHARISPRLSTPREKMADSTKTIVIYIYLSLSIPYLLVVQTRKWLNTQKSVIPPLRKAITQFTCLLLINGYLRYRIFSW